MEAISEKSYGEYITENIFKPLGMNHSGTTGNEKPNTQDN